MKSSLLPLIAALVVSLAGCGTHQHGDNTKAQEDEIKAARAKLGDDERKLVEQQEFCAVQTKNRLGSMGTPYAITVKEQKVFLCCKSCEKAALKDPDATLVKVAELKEKTKAP